MSSWIYPNQETWDDQCANGYPKDCNYIVRGLHRRHSQRRKPRRKTSPLSRRLDFSKSTQFACNLTIAAMLGSFPVPWRNRGSHHLVPAPSWYISRNVEMHMNQTRGCRYSAHTLVCSQEIRRSEPRFFISGPPGGEERKLRSGVHEQRHHHRC